MGIFIFLFFGLVSAFLLFMAIGIFEQKIFKKKYEKKNPTKKDDMEIFEDEVADEGSKIYKTIKAWWNRKKTGNNFKDGIIKDND